MRENRADPAGNFLARASERKGAAYDLFSPEVAVVAPKKMGIRNRLLKLGPSAAGKIQLFQLFPGETLDDVIKFATELVQPYDVDVEVVEL